MKIKCEKCGKIFINFPSQGRRFCSVKCSRDFYKKKENSSRWKGGFYTYICKACGKEFVKPIDGHKYKFCSSSCFAKNRTGTKGANWKGGIKPTGNGYLHTLSKEHPYCDFNGYVLNHRLVAEHILGRYLKPTEIIHHIDGNKLNNNPKNLYLFVTTNLHTKHHQTNKKLKTNLFSLSSSHNQQRQMAKHQRPL